MKPAPMNSDTSHPADEPPIDDDLVAALAADTVGEPVPAGASSRIRHRLLERIAQGESRHVTVHASEHAWHALQEGVTIKVLHEAHGVMSYLLRLAAGAVLPAHRHPIDEECVVLEGSVRIGTQLVVTAGGLHLAHKDALHAPITTDEGATLFLRGAPPHPADIV